MGNKVYQQFMIKYSTVGHLEPYSQGRYKLRQPGVAPSHIKTSVMDQNNSLHRLDIIRKKYSSKERERGISSVRREESQNKESRREALKERLNQRARSNYSIGDTYHTLPFQSQRKNPSNACEVKERHQWSKEKVCERVENIKKINDKIKNILNKFEIGVEGCGRYSIVKRHNLNEQRKEADHSFKNRKLELLEQQIRSRQLPKAPGHPLMSQQKFQAPQSLKEERRESPPKQVFPFRDNAVTVNVSQNESLNVTIDQSFVLQKYNPSQARPQPNELLMLISKLCSQIEYDSEFRTSKYFFLLNLQQDKYQKLQRQFLNLGITYTLDQLTELMRFAEEEYDPFMFEIAHQDYSQYALSFVKADKHWADNIQGKYSHPQLLKQGIQSTLTLDDQEEGLVVSDFVRFINLVSGNLYKNRDLIVIMRRIGERNIDLNSVYRALCGNYK